MIRSRHALVVLGVVMMGGAWTFAGAGAGTTQVSGPISIAAGEHAGDLSTVNGSIRVGENASVGSAHTVNGSVSLASHASAAQVRTVNGSVELEDAARVTGSVHSVNGRLSLAKGSEVTGDLRNVNGMIRIASAHVGGGIDTANGGIDLEAAHVDGGIHVQKNSESSFESSTPPRVVIGPGSVVKGTLNFERPVRLYVSERATIGAVEGATPIKFSGDSPSGD